MTTDSVRHLLDDTSTMIKYHGEIARNADAAYVLCSDSIETTCSGKILDCPFKNMPLGFDVWAVGWGEHSTTIPKTA